MAVAGLGLAMGVIMACLLHKRYAPMSAKTADQFLRGFSGFVNVVPAGVDVQKLPRDKAVDVYVQHTKSKQCYHLGYEDLKSAVDEMFQQGLIDLPWQEGVLAAEIKQHASIKELAILRVRISPPTSYSFTPRTPEDWC